jgi:hypothetical protein
MPGLSRHRTVASFCGIDADFHPARKNGVADAHINHPANYDDKEQTSMKAVKVFVTACFLAGFMGIGENYAASTSERIQTVSGGGVSVAVTYMNPRRLESPQFQVALNTHSVSLDSYDFKTIVLLRDGAGKAYEPTKVENKGSGHHRTVILTFPKLSPEVKHFELVIKDIAGVKERTFRWTLE